MTTLDYILLADDRDLLELGNWVASVTNSSIAQGDDGAVYVSRPMRGSAGNLVGEVQRNFLAYPEQDPSELSLIDYFPTMVDFVSTGRDREPQYSAVVNFFIELTGTARKTMAVLRQTDLLIAVYTIDSGIVWMPPGTSPDPEDRDEWYPYLPASDQQ